MNMAKTEATLVPGLTQMAKAEASRTQETEEDIRIRQFIQKNLKIKDPFSCKAAKGIFNCPITYFFLL